MHETSHVADFRFYEELNDLLPIERRKRSFEYRFDGSPSVKEVIEAIGVPHTEVDLILVNGSSVGFEYRLQAGDRVSVYPVFESLDIASVTHLRPPPLREPKFVCDVHLGKLARRLRLLGFDVAYRNSAADADPVATALAEQRILLTRDRGLLKQRTVTHGYLVRSPHLHEQLLEVLWRFDLASRLDPFSRCALCNGPILPADRASVESALPPTVRASFQHFFQCATCGHVYWQGSDVTRLQGYAQALTRIDAPGGLRSGRQSCQDPASLFGS